MLGALASLAVAAAPASAAVHASSGNGPIPTSVGGHALAAWPQDTRDDYSQVGDLPTPTGSATFDSGQMQIRTVGSSWATSPWGGDYSGKIYWTSGCCVPKLTITLDKPVGALAFMAESDYYGTYQFTVNTQDGTSTTYNSNTGYNDANEAGWAAFYADGGDKITSVTVDSTNANQDFAVGDFESTPGTTCDMTAIRRAGQDGFAGPNDQADVSVLSAAGLALIDRVTVINGSLSIPTFPSGTTDPVVVTATKAIQGAATHFAFHATDINDLDTICQ
jgi:hypothetical protein